MTFVPSPSERKISPLAAALAMAPLYVLRAFIINPFLAVTTVFPFVILMSGASIEAGYFKTAYISTLEFLTRTLFGRTLEESTGSDGIALFFLFVLILSLALTGIEKLLGRIGCQFRIDWRHILGFMTLIYGTAAVITYGNPEQPEPIFWLLFYLFNVYSIVGYHFIGVAIDKLRNGGASTRLEGSELSDKEVEQVVMRSSRW